MEGVATNPRFYFMRWTGQKDVSLHSLALICYVTGRYREAGWRGCNPGQSIQKETKDWMARGLYGLFSRDRELAQSGHGSSEVMEFVE